jgi:hypothetical protein
MNRYHLTPQGVQAVRQAAEQHYQRNSLRRIERAVQECFGPKVKVLDVKRAAKVTL